MTDWMDYSGAPALLIPSRVAGKWSGVKTPDWTDYNRACELAWPGKGVISIGETTGYVFYSESDTHSWLANLQMYASGGWIPTAGQLDAANWEDMVVWNAQDRHYLLVNSAEDLTEGISDVDHQVVLLPEGCYEIAYAQIMGHCYGEFHRLRLTC